MTILRRSVEPPGEGDHMAEATLASIHHVNRGSGCRINAKGAIWPGIVGIAKPSSTQSQGAPVGCVPPPTRAGTRTAGRLRHSQPPSKRRDPCVIRHVALIALKQTPQRRRRASQRRANDPGRPQMGEQGIQHPGRWNPPLPASCQRTLRSGRDPDPRLRPRPRPSSGSAGPSAPHPDRAGRASAGTGRTPGTGSGSCAA